MRVLWLVTLLAVPMATGAVAFGQATTVSSSSQVAFATLSAGDVGSVTVGASGTSADITVTTLPLLIADDILDISSTQDTWSIHAELVSFTGFGLLEDITLFLHDGSSDEAQIAIADGSATQSEGLVVDLLATPDTELTAVGTGTGSVTFDLVLEPDAGGAALRYRCTLAVG